MTFRLNSFLVGFTRLMPVWVVIAGISGFLRPQLFYPLKTYTEWFFAFTMLGIGAVLKYEDFVPVLKKPHLVILGTCTQFAIMPLSGFLLATWLNLPEALIIGMVIVGSVPGAMASNIMCYLAKADVAYSIALTTTATLLSPLLTPVFVYIFAHHLIEVDFLSMVFSILKMVIIPLVAGFMLKMTFKQAVKKAEHFFPAFSTVFIAFICGLIVALNQKYILRMTPLIFLAIVLHNLIGLCSGNGLGRLYRFDIRRRRTLAIEVGMQNAGMGAVLALKHFSSETALVSAIFATWCVVTASIVIEIWSKKNN